MCGEGGRRGRVWYDDGKGRIGEWGRGVLLIYMLSRWCFLDRRWLDSLSKDLTLRRKRGPRVHREVI